jgi:hypothetical protein
LRSGYWQTEIAEEDRDKTAFSTRSNQYRFTVLSMGLANAPAQFQRLMNLVLVGLNFESCLVYLDDIICFSRTFEEHLTRLAAIFDRLVASDLKLSAKKCHLFQPEVDFLGHVVSRDGIAVSPDKINTVLNWPRPQNVQEVRSFLGLAGYYRKYVEKYADIAKPLQILTNKNMPFVWTEAQEKAFCVLKLRLVSAPILASPIDDGLYVLDTDASQIGLGAVLQQEQAGQLKVIAYGSRNLTKAEQNYNTTRRELLAVVYGLKQFRQFLLGRPFRLQVDHSALIYLRRTPEVMGQAARWLEFIEEYDFTIQHRAGTAHSNCDALSRKPATDKYSGSPRAELEDLADSHCFRLNENFTAASSRAAADHRLPPKDLPVIPNCEVQPTTDPRSRLTPAADAGSSASTDAPTDTARLPSTDSSKASVDNGNLPSRPTDTYCGSLPEPIRLQACTGSSAEVGSTSLPPADVELSTEVIIKEQRADVALLPFIEALTNAAARPSWASVQSISETCRVLWGQFDSLKLVDDILRREYYSPSGSVLRTQIVMPTSLQRSFLRQLHDSGGNVATAHLSSKKTKEHVQQRAYWPSWRTDTEKYCRRCALCQSVQHGAAPRHGRMQQYEPVSVGDRLHVDLTGPHVPSRQGSVYILTAIDAFSRYLWCVPLKNKQAVTVASALVQHVLVPLGSYNSLVTDQGTEFCNEVLECVTRLLDIQKLRTTAYRPQANGRIERVHRTINGMLSKVVDDNQSTWQDRLAGVTASYNAAYHEATGYSPYFIMYGREYRTPIDLAMGIGETAYGNNTIDYVDQLQRHLSEAYAEVNNKLRTYTQRMKQRYDLRVREQPLQSGQFAMFYIPQRKIGRNQKWRRLCKLVRVTKRLNDVLYCVQLSPRAHNIIAHIDRLRRFDGDVPEPWKTFVNRAATTDRSSTDGPSTDNRIGACETSTDRPSTDRSSTDGPSTDHRIGACETSTDRPSTARPSTKQPTCSRAPVTDTSTAGQAGDTRASVLAGRVTRKPAAGTLMQSSGTESGPGQSSNRPHRRIHRPARFSRLQSMERQRRRPSSGPYQCAFCDHPPFNSPPGLRSHTIIWHGKNCSWTGVPRDFVDDAERARVTAAVRKNQRHKRLDQLQPAHKRHLGPSGATTADRCIAV